MLKRLLQGQIDYIKQSIKHRIYYRLLPENPLHDDLYLVSYPKSGVTWLMYLLANVNLQMSGIEKKVTFFNLENLIPDIHNTKFLKTEVLPFPGCRIIKSHSTINPFYNRIIYLIRDPRDVMVSYYHFTKNLNFFKGSISEFIRTNTEGIDSWCNHINSWTTEVKPYQYINYIRYEDMKTDAKAVVRRIYTLLGYDLSDEVLDYAVKMSAFNSMKKDEEYYSSMNVMINPEFKFVREGKAGGYKSSLQEDDMQFINYKAEKWMKMFGYK